MHRQSHMSLCANPTFLRFNLATKRLPSARRPSPNLTFLGFNLATKRLPSRRQRCRCGCLFTLSYLLGGGIYLFIIVQLLFKATTKSQLQAYSMHFLNFCKKEGMFVRGLWRVWGIWSYKVHNLTILYIFLQVHS